MNEQIWAVSTLASKKDIGSLVGMPIPRRGGGSLEMPAKQSDLTALLVLAPDAAPVVELAPEMATTAPELLADTTPPASPQETFFTLCAKRIHQFMARRGREGR
ncbi:MAG TPA: hypothetical protein VL993_19050 [Stellaceae bacterium]|nr:hypothetical protein [Stellaceae bacterium]